MEDTWLEDDTNHGDRDRLLVGKSAGNPKKRTLIKFDLSGIPAGVELTSADLRLQYYGRGGNVNATWVDRSVAAHKVLVDWNELEATTTRRMIDAAAQNVNQIDVLWSTAYGASGVDYSATAEATQYITPDYPRWVSWDIKDLTQQWVDVPATNYGVMLLATNEDVDGFDLRFRSSDYGTANTMDFQFRPKLEIRWTLATRTTYFLKDHLGTTRAAITDAGDVVGYDDYDPWGLILKKRSMTSSQPNMPFKYTGKEWDDDNGLDWYYFGARYYDPVVGRFLSVDPLISEFPDVSSYIYPYNNPIRFTDPTGMAGHDENDGDENNNGMQDIAERAQQEFNEVVSMLKEKLFSAVKRTPEGFATLAKTVVSPLVSAAKVAPAYGLRTLEVTAQGADAVSDGLTVATVVALATGHPEIAAPLFALGKV